MNSALQARADAANAKLGIPAAIIRRRKLPLCAEAEKLVVVEIGPHGRKHRLTPAAATAWRKMKAAARRDGIGLKIVSAFRSFERQVEIIRRKIAEGQSVRQILAFSAPPGYSEHHTGGAVVGAGQDSVDPAQPPDELRGHNPSVGPQSRNGDARHQQRVGDQKGKLGFGMAWPHIEADECRGSGDS